MDQVRYGIIGFGGIAELRLAKEGFGLDSSRFTKTERAVLITGWDPSPARRRAAEALGITCSGSIEEILDNPLVDAVIVATNNRNHAPVAKRTLLAGKHVFLEKPAGVSMPEVRELVALASSQHLSLGIDHMMVKNAYNQLARDMVRSNTIGRLDHMVLHMEFSYGKEPGEAATWRCADPLELGGPIGDVGSHCFYMAEFLAGEPITALSCTYAPKRLGIVVEDGAYMRFTTRSGIEGTIRVSFDQTRGNDAQTLLNLGFELYGDTGEIDSHGTLFQLSGHKDEPIGLSLDVLSQGRRVMCTPPVIENIYRKQIEEHALSIMENEPMDGMAALHNLDLILKSHESAGKGGIHIEVRS
ncbi:MAG: Gfo/Idh/MocA family protein [Sphaerochaetaceae bacterium]